MIKKIVIAIVIVAVVAVGGWFAYTNLKPAPAPAETPVVEETTLTEAEAADEVTDPAAVG